METDSYTLEPCFSSSFLLFPILVWDPMTDRWAFALIPRLNWMIWHCFRLWRPASWILLPCLLVDKNWFGLIAFDQGPSVDYLHEQLGQPQCPSVTHDRLQLPYHQYAVSILLHHSRYFLKSIIINNIRYIEISYFYYNLFWKFWWEFFSSELLHQSN